MPEEPDHTSPQQRAVCARVGVSPVPARLDLIVGVAANLADREVWPLNGLRHPPEGDATGWFLWAGEEWSEDADFFKPTHVVHLAELRPECLPYLALPPGWRFLVAPGYEDVWEDEALRDL